MIFTVSVANLASTSFALVAWQVPHHFFVYDLAKMSLVGFWENIPPLEWVSDTFSQRYWGAFTCSFLHP